jgi:hypothetical protein
VPPTNSSGQSTDNIFTFLGENVLDEYIQWLAEQLYSRRRAGLNYIRRHSQELSCLPDAVPFAPHLSPEQVIFIEYVKHHRVQLSEIMRKQAAVLTDFTVGIANSSLRFCDPSLADLRRGAKGNREALQ